MTREEQLDQMVKKVGIDLLACEEFADEHGLSFYFTYDRHYGFEDQYISLGAYQKEYPNNKYRWAEFDPESEFYDEECEWRGWQSSGAYC